MPTVLERITVSVDTGDLDQRVAAQVAQLQQVVELIRQLVDDPPDDVGDFLDLAANLPVPEFSVEGDFASALAAARSSLPADLDGVTGAVTGDLGQFATLVRDRLQPLLQDAVGIAAAIERLVALDFRCELGGAPAGGGGGGAEPNPGAERMASTAQQVQQVNDLLDRLPPSPSPGGLLEFLFSLPGDKERNKLFQLTLPVVDDIVEPLRTLVRWAAMSPAEVGDELEATITLLRQRLRAATSDRIDALGADLAGLQPQLALPELTTFGDDYGAALDDLVAALLAADAAATVAPVAALNGALDIVAPTLASWEGGIGATLEQRCVRLDGLADELLDGIGHLLTLLEPVELPGRVSVLLPTPQPPAPETVQAVQDAVQPVVDWLNELIALLDFSAVQGEVGGVAGEAQALADQLEQGLTGVALQVQSLFDDLGAQLASLDLTSLQDQFDDQIAQYGAGLERQLGNAAAPASAALGDAISTLSDALDAFDPADVVAALQSVLAAITAVLEGAEVQGAIEQVRSAIASVTETLEQLSFAPVTDEVVALIEQMTRALSELQQTDLNEAAKAALAVALQVLPDDLRPVTDPLLAEFDELIETGPVPLLERVAQKPAELLDAIGRFQPGALVGDTLAVPYHDALARAEAFQPGALLDGADAALAQAKAVLVESAGPGRALTLLSGPLDELKRELERYSPDALLQPLEEEIEGAIEQVIAASPVDEIFAQVNRVFDLIAAALDVPRNLVATMQRLDALLQGFADSDAQIDGWRDGLLDKVLGATNAAAIGTALAGFSDAVTDAAHAALLSRHQTTTESLVDALAAFAPGERTNRLVVAYGRARALVGGLADAPEKDAVVAVLDRFDPSRAQPLRLSLRLQQCLEQAQADLAASAQEWQELVEDPQGLLVETAAVTADVNGLRTLLAGAIDPVLAPLRHLFSLLESVRPALAGMLTTVNDLVTELTEGAAALLTGPGSLQAIGDAIQQVVDTLRNIDLGFLRESLEQLFRQLVDQLDTLDPARLAQTVDGAFAQLLDGIGIDSVIPSASIAALDASYASVLDKLRALDPAVLITEVVQPEYDATVVPLVEAFDLTPAFNALIEFLRGLGDELDGELERVNSAYQGLRAARPSLAGSINVNLSF